MLAASASPHLTSRPPSCSVVIYPFSWHSMTQPMSQPNSLTSTQARSIWVLSQETSTGFVQPVAQPALTSPRTRAHRRFRLGVALSSAPACGSGACHRRCTDGRDGQTHCETGGRPFVHVYAFWDHVRRVIFNGQGAQARPTTPGRVPYSYSDCVEGSNRRSCAIPLRPATGHAVSHTAMTCCHARWRQP